MEYIVRTLDGLLHSLLKNLVTLETRGQTGCTTIFVHFSCSKILLCMLSQNQPSFNLLPEKRLQNKPPSLSSKHSLLKDIPG